MNSISPYLIAQTAVMGSAGSAVSLFTTRFVCEEILQQSHIPAYLGFGALAFGFFSALPNTSKGKKYFWGSVVPLAMIGVRAVTSRDLRLFCSDWNNCHQMDEVIASTIVLIVGQLFLHEGIKAVWNGLRGGNQSNVQVASHKSGKSDRPDVSGSVFQRDEEDKSSRERSLVPLGQQRQEPRAGEVSTDIVVGGGWDLGQSLQVASLGSSIVDMDEQRVETNSILHSETRVRQRMTTGDGGILTRDSYTYENPFYSHKSEHKNYTGVPGTDDVGVTNPSDGPTVEDPDD